MWAIPSTEDSLDMANTYGRDQLDKHCFMILSISMKVQNTQSVLGSKSMAMILIILWVATPPWCCMTWPSLTILFLWANSLNVLGWARSLRFGSSCWPTLPRTKSLAPACTPLSGSRKWQWRGRGRPLVFKLWVLDIAGPSITVSDKSKVKLIICVGARTWLDKGGPGQVQPIVAVNLGGPAEHTSAGLAGETGNRCL